MADVRRESGRRKRRRRRFLLVLTLVTVGLVTVDLVNGTQTEPESTVRFRASQSPGVALGVAPSTSSSPAVTVPKHGSGTFTSASSATPIRGSGGTLIRYRVVVEDGSGQDVNAFAAAADITLSNPNGWTHGHQWRFQRVTSGPADATVMLATPDTTDKICLAGGINPKGYTSCRTDNKVVINLARWLLAVPAFLGDVATYREYVINHEMGHQLGHGHVLCNGPGQPAPVMLQQTYGLHGCKPNPWPFVNGRYLTGVPTAGQ